MQHCARNMMAVTAASAVLAAGVVAVTPVAADITAPRIVTADIALVADAACIPGTGTCPTGVYLDELIQTFLSLTVYVPAYAVTQAAYLAGDVMEVAGAGVAYGATVTAAVAGPALQGALSGLLLGNGYLQGQPAAVPECGGSFCGDVGSVPTVMMARQRLDDAVGQLKTDWANTFSPAHYQEYVAGLAQGSLGLTPVPEVASVRSRPVAAVASRARAASATPRESTSAKAAAASVETAPTAEQGQRRATRGAAHRAERSGTGVENP